MTRSKRISLTLVAAMVLILLTSTVASAASWWGSNGFKWTVTTVCRNGAEVQVRLYPSDDPTPGAYDSVLIDELTYSGFYDSGVYKGIQKITLPPQHGIGMLAAGSGTVYLDNHATPLHYDDDSPGMAGGSGVAYYYGTGYVAWNNELPVGQGVAIRQGTGGDQYFVANVSDCYVPLLSPGGLTTGS